MSEEVSVFVCPQCKSVDVKHPFGIKNLFGIIPLWECRKCKFKGPSFPKATVNKKDLTKK